MLNIRYADERGLANLGWLNSHHTFSFGHYYDPQFMGFGPLRVINEDRVQPGQGFDTHQKPLSAIAISSTRNFLYKKMTITASDYGHLMVN